ncbi:MAG: C25 family cysteine peptidase [Bacteroidales bacterium]|nr:C25 family cysteine peptidase [Bacteroidales bacterium]
MKRVIFSVILSLTVVMLYASDGFQVRYTQPQGGTHQLEFTTDSYSVTDVTLSGVTYSRIDFEGKIVTQKKGFAELPYLNATVMIDPVKNVTLEIIPGSYEDISLSYPLVPSRGVIYRDQDPSTVPYIIGPRSITDSWYPANLAENTEPFILRDIRGTSVYVYPFQYNAARQVLRIYKSITVRLVENNSISLNPLPKVPTVIVREMNGIYKSVFINYASLNRDNLTIGEFGDIHVIVTSRDEAAIQPYVQWKREKGYNLSEEVVPSGTTVNANVQAAYDNNNNILYVLLVGDWTDIQCETNSYGRPMDPQVGTVVGTDDFADIAVGRFSANSPADVTVQVNKVINYEKLPEMGGTWYASATGMASAEGAGIGDDGEADAAHESVIFNDKLEPFTYDTFTTIYDPGATIAMVSNAVNTGTSVINYTGHGWPDGWGTTGFSSTNVAALTNENKLPFIISVACNNGDFDLGTCFAEAWLRKENGGAIMFMGASISQPWSEPMRGQDYFMDVLIGGYDYSAHPGQDGINTTEQRTTLGSMIFNGLTLMCVESGGSADWETATTWNFFGDPSIQARTATPVDLTLSNYMIMVGIPFITTVTSTGSPVENAMVTLSQDGLFFTGITDVTGSVTIDHTLNPGNAKLVVTGFNTETIYEDVSVIPPDGAYITVSSIEINDAAGNGDGLLDYGESAFLTIGLTNVGTADASNVIAEISSGDEYIGITGASASYGTIPAGETVTITNGFEINALENIPDLHIVMFGLDATGTSGRETWSGSFAIPGHAPILEMAEYLVDDSGGNNNGRLDPGETATILISALNAGSADAYNVMGSLSTGSQYVTVNNSPLAYGDIIAGTSAGQSFEVTVDQAAPAGEAPLFSFDISADLNITGYDEFVEYIGQIPVLLLDWDVNHNSPAIIEQCLNNLEVGYDKMEAFPPDRNLYASIFVCLGTYDNNYVLTADEGQILADYLEQGGNLFMEGADTWFYDAPTAVHPMFNIAGLEDGNGDLAQLDGQAGTIAEGMSYLFNGDNNYIDHLGAIPPAQMMFMNSDPQYGAGVSYDAGTYRTVGFSFEFGGLQDGDKNKDDLMIQILEFFNIQGVWTDVKDNQPDASVRAGSYPNPFREETVIRFETEKESRVSLEVYNINGQLINRLLEARVGAGIHEVRWDGSSSAGNRVAEGMYFYRLQAGNEIITGKLMRME